MAKNPIAFVTDYLKTQEHSQPVGVQYQMNKELIPFLISQNDEKICLITDYDIKSATKQAETEVAEAFALDIETSPLNIIQVPLKRTFDGITAKQHIAECANAMPQRIYDFV